MKPASRFTERFRGLAVLRRRARVTVRQVFIGVQGSKSNDGSDGTLQGAQSIGRSWSGYRLVPHGPGVGWPFWRRVRVPWFQVLGGSITLTVAVGSIDGEAAKVMSAIASRLVATNAPVRLTVLDSGTALAAGEMFSSGKVDLAVVRGDVGNLSQARAVVIVSYVVALMIAPPGSPIDRIDKLRGRRVGVVGAEVNSKILDMLSTEYGFDRSNTFKELTPANAQRALQSKEVAALLVVMPLSRKYLALIRGLFPQVPVVASDSRHRFCRGDGTSRARI